MRIVLFGATGSAGRSILDVALAAPDVDEVRAVVRRTLGLAEAKLSEVVHADFLDYGAIGECFTGVDACFWALGISVGQVDGEAAYRRITHDFALAAARELKQRSPAAAFHFVSGQGAKLDSRMMWARVKAETERDLIAETGAVCWRPAFIDGAGSQSEPKAYKLARPLFRLLSPLRGVYVKGTDLGRAMLALARTNARSRIVENREIRALATKDKALG